MTSPTSWLGYSPSMAASSSPSDCKSKPFLAAAANIVSKKTMSTSTRRLSRTSYTDIHSRPSHLSHSSSPIAPPLPPTPSSSLIDSYFSSARFSTPSPKSVNHFFVNVGEAQESDMFPRILAQELVFNGENTTGGLHKTMAPSAFQAAATGSGAEVLDLDTNGYQYPGIDYFNTNPTCCAESPTPYRDFASPTSSPTWDPSTNVNLTPSSPLPYYLDLSYNPLPNPIPIPHATYCISPARLGDGSITFGQQIYPEYYQESPYMSPPGLVRPSYLAEDAVATYSMTNELAVDPNMIVFQPEVQNTKRLPQQQQSQRPPPLSWISCLDDVVHPSAAAILKETERRAPIHASLVADPKSAAGFLVFINSSAEDRGELLAGVSACGTSRRRSEAASHKIVKQLSLRRKSDGEGRLKRK